MWAVIPSLRPWRGDTRRNSQPYYIGQGMSWTEYNQARVAKQSLERRGIACHVYLLNKEESV